MKMHSNMFPLGKPTARPGHQKSVYEADIDVDSPVGPEEQACEALEKGQRLVAG